MKKVRPCFGNGKVCHSIERMTMPVVIAGQNVFLTTEITEKIDYIIARQSYNK